MRLVPDWRRVLVRSLASQLGFAGMVLLTATGVLFVFVDDLGRSRFVAIYAACSVGAWLCNALIPFARILRQKTISGGSDAAK